MIGPVSSDDRCIRQSIDSLLAMLDALIVTTALSAIRVDLGGSIEEIESLR
jgi:hypothetical protein